MIRNPDQREAIGQSAGMQPNSIDEGLFVGRLDDPDPSLLVSLIILFDLLLVPSVGRGWQINGLLPCRNRRIRTVNLVLFTLGQIRVLLDRFLTVTVVDHNIISGAITSSRGDYQGFIPRRFADSIAQLVHILKERRVTHPTKEQQPHH